MARAYGRFTTDIWRDKKFLALPIAEQWAYFMLGTQPDISAAGTLALTVKRWSRHASDSTPDALSDVLSGLMSKGFLVVDNDTEELLVRSFAKWDGGINNDKRRPVVLEAAQTIASPKIRVVIAQELRELGVSDALCDALADGLSHAVPDRQSGFDRVVVTEVGTYPNPQPFNHNPQPATLEHGGGNRSNGHEPEPSNSPHCSQHPNGTEQPCGPCGSARRRHEERKTERQLREEQHRKELADARAACTNCNPAGWIEDDDGQPLRRCNHQPEQRKATA